MAPAGTDGGTVHVDVLGPVRVRAADGSPAPVRGRIQLGLLSMLATAEDRGLPTAALVDGLWGDHPPGNPRHALQAQVSRLRRALPAGVRVHAAASGYRLDRRAVTVDVDRFLDLARRGRAAVEGGRLARGAALLHEALEVWRGPVFDDLADAPGLAPAAARLEAVRVRTLEHRVEADVRSGATEGLVAELRGLVARHPTRERLWRALMAALDLDGQQAEALAVYRSAWQALAEHAGVEPGPLLTRAHQSLLRQQPVLSPGSTADAARATTTPRPPRPRLRRLAAGPFVGRRRDRHGLERLWEAGAAHLQVAVVAGDAGVGKTRLLAEVGTRLGRRGAPVRYVRCDVATPVPLRPFAELLREDLDAVPRDHHADRLGRAPGELARLLPELAVHGRPADGSRDVQRAHLLDAIASWLARASHGTPLVLLVDDLQWADAATLTALRHVVRGPDHVRGLLVLAHRGGIAASDDPVTTFLADLARDQRQVRRLRLDGLAPHPTAELLAGELPPEASVDLPSAMSLAPRLHQLTAGNPFRTIELARRVGDVLVGRSGLCHDPAAVPDTAVEEVAAALRGSRRHVRAV